MENLNDIHQHLLSPDKDIVSALEALRDDVENINHKFRGGFREKVLKGDEVCTVNVKGMTYGYRLHDRGFGLMEREIMVRPTDERIRIQDINEHTLPCFLLPVYEVFFKEGYTDINIFESVSSLIFQQQFSIAFLFEHKPGLVVPGRKN